MANKITVRNLRKHVVRFSKNIDIPALGAVDVSAEEFAEARENKYINDALTMKFLKATIKKGRQAK